jgi:beta-phosphoglucomutase-like phosphatase (HAD superfamily)
MGRIKEVIFDCDGTIVDSEIIVQIASRQILTDIARAYPEKPIDIESLLHRFAGYHFSDMLAALGAKLGATFDTETLLEQRRIMVDAGLAHVQAVPNADRTLSILSAMGIDYCVASSSHSSHIDSCLEKTGLAAYIPQEKRFSAHDSLPEPCMKPHPDIYLHALRERGLTAEEAIAVEDSEAGALAASGAGILTVGTLAGTHTPVSLKEERARALIAAGASVVIDDLSFLPTVIENLHSAQALRDALPPGTFIIFSDSFGARPHTPPVPPAAAFLPPPAP